MAIAYDSHLHTGFSPDGVSTMEEYARSALVRSLKGLCFTEHVDVLCSEPEFNPGADLAACAAALEHLRQHYGHRLDLGFGVEAGLISWSIAETKEYLSGYRFDYVIASYHYPERIPNLMYPENWAFVTREEGLRRYLQGFLPCLRAYPDYDCVGHLTYFARYCPLPDPSPRYLDAPDEIDALFRHLIENGKGLEINTSTYPQKGFFLPDLELAQRYRELGGEIVTIGSDAHDAADLARGFDAVAGMLLAAGFTHYAVYRERRPVFLPLE